MRTTSRYAIVLVSLMCLTPWARAEDWPRFRGAGGSAVSSEERLPVTWSETENIKWKVDLPGPGSSSPIVSGDRVFVTCYSGYGVDGADPGDQQQLTRHLVCVSRQNGSVLWQASVPAVLPEDDYRGRLTDHGYASHTPATDGQRIFAFFGKSGVVAFDWDGNQLWQQSVGTGSAIMGWGSASSVVLHENMVIVNANAESQSLVALDKESGREIWKADAEGYAGSWSTPMLVEAPDGKTELVVFMPGEVWGLDPSDGGLFWYCSGVRGSPTTSVVAKDGVVYAVGGGPRGAGATAIRVGGQDEVSESHVVWKQNFGTYVPSPVLADGYLYWVDDRGMASCVKADTGERVYRERVPDAGGVYASAVAADGKLYAVTRRNGTFVLALGPEFKVLAHNRLESDDTDFNASPAVSSGQLLLRSNRSLYCIGAK